MHSEALPHTPSSLLISPIHGYSWQTNLIRPMDLLLNRAIIWVQCALLKERLKFGRKRKRIGSSSLIKVLRDSYHVEGKTTQSGMRTQKSC